MRAIQGWMCGIDFTCELGEANGGNVVFPTKENLIANRACVEPREGYCAPVEVFVMSKNDLTDLLQTAGVKFSEVRVANWGTRTFEDVMYDRPVEK